MLRERLILHTTTASHTDTHTLPREKIAIFFGMNEGIGRESHSTLLFEHRFPVDCAAVSKGR